MSEDMMRQHPEVPIIVIEHDDDQNVGDGRQRAGSRRRWLYVAGAVLGAIVLALAAVEAYRLWRAYRVGIDISTTPAQNIQKLKQPVTPETAEVVMTSDSILGVALDFYAIHGLKASIEFAEPDTADTSVYLYARCADHRADSTYLGSLVAEGKEYQKTDRSRLGYMAMADGRMVIGISRSEKVKDYVLERGGSFFRQFILVSNGEIPTRFFLHGKVERRAIGRMGNTLYYIATRHKETMWDFADALREYGFVDVIYITGGTDYCFYRTNDGVRHDIGDAATYPHTKWKGIIPWLVFRK